MWVSILPRKNTFPFFSLLTRRPFLPRPITGKMRIYRGLCCFNWEHPGLDCARAWTAHWTGLCTAWTSSMYHTGLRTGLDFARPGLVVCMMLDCARPGLVVCMILDWDIRTGRQKDEKWARPGSGAP